MSRTERLLILIDFLRSRKLPVTAEHMATKLGVSDRSIYRDIETLRLLGAPIDAQAGIGYVLQPGFLLPPLMLTGEEVDALTLGVNWVQQHGDPALGDAAATALSKITNVLPAASANPDELPFLVTVAHAENVPDTAMVAQVRNAVRTRQKIAVTYEDLGGATSERVLWPIALVYLGGVLILAAWCETRQAFRHFRVDRLRAMVQTLERYPERRSTLVRRWREQDLSADVRP